MKDETGGANSATTSIVSFRANQTIKWEVIPGDYIVWVRWQNVFSPSPDITIRDFWELREGDLVSVTSDIEDLPSWFELHPTEVCGYAACLMMEKKLKAGYKPTDKTKGPNVWRVVTGDRLVWVSCTARPEENPVKAVVDFQTCALVYGERRIHPNDLVWFMSFGAPLETPLPEGTAERVRMGLDAVRALGCPRVTSDIGFGWRMGG